MAKSKWIVDSFIRTGLRHKDNNEPCQDYVRLDGTRGAALSDGISRSKDSEKASEFCTAQALAVCKEVASDKNLLARLLSETEDSKHILRYITEEIVNRTKLLLCDYPKADATLTFVYFLDQRHALIGYVGDSSIIIINDDNKGTIFTQQKDYGGATESIAHPHAKDLLKLHILDMDAYKIRAFLLTSDGLEGEIYTKNPNIKLLRNCQYYINALFEPQGHEKVNQYIDNVTRSAVFDDDISLAILARGPVSLPVEPKWLCTCGHRNPLTASYCEKCDSDYFNIYPDFDKSKFPSASDYFTYLNAHPEEELKVLRKKKSNEYIPPTIIYTQKAAETQIESTAKPTQPANNAKPKASANQSKETENEDTMLFSKRFIAISTIIAILLCCILAMNFLQILSISNELTEIKKELDILISDTQPETTTDVYSATGDETTTTADIDKTEDTTITATENSPVSQEENSSMLRVKQTTSLYPEPNYLYGVVGYAVADEEITLISVKAVNDVKWIKVRTASGITGWAPEELFIVSDSVTTVP